MKNLYVYIIIIFCLYGCSQNNTEIACPNCGCDNVDDCLSKYKFEEARKHGSLSSDWEKTKIFQKIIITESEYWISQNELDKAYNVARELLINFREDTEFGEKKYSELVLIIIKKYCQEKQFDKAMELGLELPEKIVKETTKVDITGDGRGNSDSYCNNKYINTKANLKTNQEIDSYRGCDFNYKIRTYDFPRSEAKKLIEDYKKLKNE